MVASGARAVRQPARLRLTRRGRVVVLTFFVILACGVAALLATASRASNPVDTPAPSVIVQPYDTLWSIAGRTVPGRSPRVVVHEIRRLNGLAGYTVHPGERLLVPRAR